MRYLLVLLMIPFLYSCGNGYHDEYCEDGYYWRDGRCVEGYHEHTEEEQETEETTTTTTKNK